MTPTLAQMLAGLAGQAIIAALRSGASKDDILNSLNESGHVPPEKWSEINAGLGGAFDRLKAAIEAKEASGG